MIKKQDKELFKEYERIIEHRKKIPTIFATERERLWGSIIDIERAFKQRGYRVTRYSERVVFSLNGKTMFRHFI